MNVLEMMPQLSDSLMPFALIYPLIWALRHRTVRRSHRRVVLRTVERPLRWITALVYIAGLISSIMGVLDQRWFSLLGIFTYSFAIVWWSYLWARDNDDDEDDFWKRSWRRLKARLRLPVSTLATR